MINIIKNIKIKKIVSMLFLIGFGIYAFLQTYQYSEIVVITKRIKSIIRIISFCLMIPKIILQKYKIKELLISIALYVITFLFIAFGGDKSLIIIPTILVGIKEFNINVFAKILFYILLSCLIIHCSYFVIDYVKTENEFLSMFHLSDYPITNKIKFNDYNMFAFRYTCALMLYIYLTNRSSKKFLKIILLLIISTFVLFISQSRASFIISILLILYLLLDNSKFFSKILCFCKYLSLLFGLSFSIFLMIIPYDSNNVLYLLNQKLNGRLSIFNTAYKYIGINIFPNLDKFDNLFDAFDSYMLPDNSYISLLLKWGLLLFIILLVFVLVFIHKNKDTIIDYYICLLLIWFMVEYISMEYVLYFVPLVVINNYFKTIEIDKNKDN